METSTRPNAQNVAHRLVDAYYALPDPALLSQGDLLSCEALKANLPKAHKIDPCKDAYPYFFSNYAYGIILNADCDLFAKNGRKPKVKCMQVAAVVEASAHIQNLLLQVSSEDHYKTRLIDEKTYSAVVRKFQSLINNQEKIYFYLPENWNIGFKSAHLVRLDTSVSFQINDTAKYKAIIDSRIPATLEEPYKSKLGENFANLFDRTGLTDVDDQMGARYEEWLQQELEKYFVRVPDWIYRRAIPEVKKLASETNVESEDYGNKLVEIIAKHGKQEKYEFEDIPAFRSVKKVIENKVDAKTAEQMLKSLISDAAFKNAFSVLASMQTEKENANSAE